MAKNYSTDQLSAGDQFVVRGRTSYPRLTHVIDGDELQEEIKRATQQGRIPTTVPHTYTTLVDATIEYANPQAPTLAELYAQERLYQSKDGKTCYTAIRKSPTLADYGVIDQNDFTKVQGIYLDPNKTLANGLDVKCYFRVFDTKAGMHKGVSLDAIIFQEPIKYYEFSNADSQLAARGLTWEPPKGEAPVYNPQLAAANNANMAPTMNTQASAYGAGAGVGTCAAMGAGQTGNGAYGAGMGAGAGYMGNAGMGAYGAGVPNAGQGAFTAMNQPTPNGMSGNGASANNGQMAGAGQMAGQMTGAGQMAGAGQGQPMYAGTQNAGQSAGMPSGNDMYTGNAGAGNAGTQAQQVTPQATGQTPNVSQTIGNTGSAFDNQFGGAYMM